MADRKDKAILPPKRGLVKSQIFESLAGAVSSVASKAGELITKISGGGGSVSTSTTTSPPCSEYDSNQE